METKKQLRKLWDCCFQEDTAFSDLYFQMRNIEQNSIFIERDQRIISAMQLLPYPFTFHNDILETSYISGACTHPEYRKQGHMNRLILDAFSILHRKGIPFVSLIPAHKELFNYYAKFGFVANFNYTIIQNDFQRNKGKKNVQNDNFDIEKAYAYFCKKLRERNSCIQHDKQDFKMIVKEMEQGGRKPLVRWKDEKAVGIAFSYATTDHKIIVKEILYDDEETRQWLLSESGASNIVCKGKDHHLGMMRITNAMSLIKSYAASHPDLTTCFHLQDNLIIENCGDYLITDGKVMKNNERHYEKVEIESLTLAVFGDDNSTPPEPLNGFASPPPYMSLMLD